MSENQLPQLGIQSVIQHAAMLARQSLGFTGDGDDVPMISMDTSTNTAAFEVEYLGHRIMVAVAPVWLWIDWETTPEALRARIERLDAKS